MENESLSPLSRAYAWVMHKCYPHTADVFVIRDNEKQCVARIAYFYAGEYRVWYCIDLCNGKPTRIRRICKPN